MVNRRGFIGRIAALFGAGAALPAPSRRFEIDPLVAETMAGLKGPRVVMPKNLFDPELIREMFEKKT